MVEYRLVVREWTPQRGFASFFFSPNLYGPDRHAQAVVEKGEEQILADIPHGCTAHPSGFGNATKISTEQGDASTFHSNVGACAHGDAHMGLCYPCHVGALPPQLAALNQIQVASQEMAVEAAISGDREMVYHACLYDPFTAAVCSMDEIRRMVDELFDAQRQFLPQFKQ